eukprot:7519015-Pyramimonas_sp.AAC.1
MPLAGRVSRTPRRLERRAHRAWGTSGGSAVLPLWTRAAWGGRKLERSIRQMLQLQADLPL